MHARSAKIKQKPLAPMLNIEAIQEVAGDFACLTGRIKPEGIISGVEVREGGLLRKKPGPAALHNVREGRK